MQAIVFLQLICCLSCGKDAVLERPAPDGQKPNDELEHYSRPVQGDDFIRLPRPTDPVQPMRWLDTGAGQPKVVAVGPFCRQAVVSTKTQTIVYDLENRKYLHEWNELFHYVLFSADGRRLATLSTNKISFWDTETYQRQGQVTGVPLALDDPRSEREMTFSWSNAAIDRSGELVALDNKSQHFDANLPEGLLIYSTRDGKLQQSISFSSDYELSGIQFLLDGRRLMCTYSNRKQRQRYLRELFDSTTGEKLAEFNMDGLVVVSSPDGASIATAQCTGNMYGFDSQWNGPTTLTIYDAKTMGVRRTIKYPISARQFTFSPNSQRLLVAFEEPQKNATSGDKRGHLVEWDIASGKEVFKAIDENKTFATVAYSPSGNRRFATSEAPNFVDDDVERWLQGWEVDSGKALEIKPYTINYNGREELHFFPRGQLFIDKSESLSVRNVLDGESVMSPPEHRTPVSDVEFIPGDDKFVASGATFGGSVHSVLADLSSGKMRLWSAGANVSFIHQGRSLFSRHNGLQIMDVLSGEPRWAFKGLSGHLAISRDGNWIAAASYSGLGRRPDDPLLRTMLIEVSRPFEPIIIRSGASALAFHPDNKRLLAASSDSIKEYEVSSGNLLRTLWMAPGHTLDMTYSQDGKWVSIAGMVGHQDPAEPVRKFDRGWAVIVDSSTGKAQELNGHSGPVSCVAFSETSDLVATGSHDNTVRVWNLAGKPLKTLSAHRGPIADIAFNSGATLLLSAASDGAALWDLSTTVAPSGPTPVVAQSFHMFEKPDDLNVKFDVTAQGLFDGVSVLRELGPTRQVSVEKQDWSCVKVGKGNREALYQWERKFPHWLDVASSNSKIAVASDFHLKNGNKWNKPFRQKFHMQDTSFDQTQAVFVSSSEKSIVLVGIDGQLIQKWAFPESSEEVSDVTARLSRSKKTLVVQSNLNRDGRNQLDVYDVDTAAHKFTIPDIYSPHSPSFFIDPLERNLLVRESTLSYFGRPFALALYDLQSGRPVASKEVMSFDVTYYSQFGNYIIERGLSSNKVKLYEAQTLELAVTIECDLKVMFADVTKDGQRLLVGQEYTPETYLLSCWDLNSGKQLWSRAGSAGRDCKFSPTGKHYLCGDKDVWTLWDVESGYVQCVMIMDAENRHYSPQHAIFSPQGDALFLGSTNGPQLWPNAKNTAKIEAQRPTKP